MHTSFSEGFIVKRLLPVVLAAVLALSCLMVAIDASDNIVIVLDPGHGGGDPGTVNSSAGLNERDIVLKISEYCAEELEKYENVEVHLTRTSNSQNPSLVERSEYAAERNADALVSVHINDASAASANGVEAFVSYYDRFSLRDLGNRILSNLSSDIGFSNRGVKTKRSENGTTYPDGALADYYGIIREAARRGVRSMLLEHGFINNSHDAALMDSDSDLKNIAIADATAIAEYFGLELKNNSSEPSTPSVQDKPILGSATATLQQSRDWAESVGATQEFIDLADMYYEYAPKVGVNPVVAYAQSALETGYGKFGGAVQPSYHNPCGLKKSDASGDTPNDFAIFADWYTGVTAHCDHLALYAGAEGFPKSDTPDTRHFAYLLGRAATVNGLSGTWAADSSYASKILNLISQIEAMPVQESSVTLNTNAIAINQGASATLIATSDPEGTVTWTSSDSSVVKVSNEGRVTGVGSGAAIIRATSTNGAYAECKVTVLPFASEIILNKTELSIPIGESEKLEAAVMPENTFENKVTWESNDETIATVSEDGTVTAVGKGSTTIVAYVNDEVRAECEVTGIRSVESISLDISEKTIFFR